MRSLARDVAKNAARTVIGKAGLYMSAVDFKFIKNRSIGLTGVRFSKSIKSLFIVLL